MQERFSFFYSPRTQNNSTLTLGGTTKLFTTSTRCLHFHSPPFTIKKLLWNFKVFRIKSKQNVELWEREKLSIGGKTQKFTILVSLPGERVKYNFMKFTNVQGVSEPVRVKCCFISLLLKFLRYSKLTRSFSFSFLKMRKRIWARRSESSKHNKNDKWCVIWNIYEKLFHIIPKEMLIRYLLFNTNIKFRDDARLTRLRCRSDALAAVRSPSWEHWAASEVSLFDDFFPPSSSPPRIIIAHEKIEKFARKNSNIYL